MQESEGKVTIVSELIAFEEKARVLDFCFSFKDTHIWPLFRPLLFRQVISDKLEAENPLVRKLGSRREGKSLLFQPIYRYLKKNCNRIKHKKIVFLLDNSGHVLREGYYRNRVYDFYAELYPEESVILESTLVQEDRKKRAVGNIAFTDIIEDKVALLAKLKKPSTQDKEAVDAFIDYLKADFPFSISEAMYEDLRRLAYIYSVKMPLYEKYYGRLWRRIKPQVVFVQQACYGFTRTCITRQLNEMGILTAELQHGYVGENHDDYHYGENILADACYQRYFPKWFLTYGEYWGRHIRIPSRIEAVGEQNWIVPLKKEDYQRPALPFQRTVLIATGLLHEKYRQTIETLLEKLDESWGIVVKIHPARLEEGDFYQEWKDHPRVQIKGAVNLYQYLAYSDAVVGDISTVLVEALAMGKQVFFYEGAYTRRIMNEDMGTFFSSDQELAGLLTENWDKAGDRTGYRQDLFAPGCDERFEKWIEKVTMRENR